MPILHRSFLFVLPALGIAAALWSGCSGDGGLIIKGCEGEPPLCVVSCSPGANTGTSPTCIEGQWVCDESLKDRICSCDNGGELMPCDVCEDDHIKCKPTNACSFGCGTICQTCEMSAGTEVIEGCTCSCQNGLYSCVEKCCSTDAACAALPGAYCAEGSCVPPLEVGCWRDADCAPGEVCQGASICPCGVECFVADQPGACVTP